MFFCDKHKWSDPARLCPACLSVVTMSSDSSITKITPSLQEEIEDLANALGGEEALANIIQQNQENFGTPERLPCCRLDQEFICGIVRNRSGIDSGELDYTIREDRVIRDLDNVILETERLLKRLKEIKGVQ